MSDAMSAPSPAEAIFFAALERAPGDRAAFLDQACAGQPELHARLEQMLAAQSHLGDFLKEPPAVPAGEATRPYEAPAEVSGTVLGGKYKLLQRIGEGGMGSVWMADQLEPVKRRVAVKWIRSERGSSRTILARFEAERQAIALMDHPHIAKLLDAGTTEGSESAANGVGQPYFIMELVKGIPLNEFCDQRKLGIVERLRLFLQICSAVQHAHQKGIIHRDLKPGNILVELHDDKPVPKVIDFGLAKALSGQQLTEHTLFTGFGMVAGTPLYMAPEQAHFNAIDVDTRADIYALGVILYELLTGTTPIEREKFKKAALDEMLRLIRESEPPTPSKRLSSTDSKPSIAASRQMEPVKLSRLVRGELDWIVMKALAKERNRRYETASAFAADVERYLRDEPVEACPPSVGYRLRKLARRNKRALATSGLVAIALLVGTAVSGWQAIEANRARSRADERSRAADGNLGKALEAVDRMLVRIGDQSLRDVPQMAGVRRQILEDALPFYRDLLAQNPCNQDIERCLADLHSQLGEAYRVLGLKAEARAAYFEARDILEDLHQRYPDNPGYTVRLALAHDNIGWHVIPRPADREPSFRRAIELVEPLVAGLRYSGLPWSDRSLLAISYQSLADIFVSDGYLEKAEEPIRKALALCRDDPEIAVDHVAQIYALEARYLRRLGRFVDALAASDRAIRTRESTFGRTLSQFDRWQCGKYWLFHADLLSDMGRLGEAEGAHRKALDLGRQVAADELASIEAGRLRQEATMGMIQFFARTGRSAEAARMVDEAVRLIDGKDHMSTAGLRRGMDASRQMADDLEQASYYLSIGELDQARPIVSHAAELMVKEPSSSSEIWFWFELANAHMKLGEKDRALEEFTKCLAFDPQSSSVYIRRGAIHFEMGRYDQARADFDRAIANPAASIWVHHENALACLATGDQLAYRRACAEILKKSGETKDPDEMWLVVWTCVLAPNSVDDYAPVLVLAHRCAKLRPHDQQSLRSVGAALFRAGRFDEALQALNASQCIPEAAQTSPAYGWYFLAMTHHGLGHDDEARQWLDKAVEHTRETLTSNKHKTGDSLTWNRRLTLELLEREAKVLLGVSAKDLLKPTK